MKFIIVVPEIVQCGPLNVIRNMISSPVFLEHNVLLVELRKSKENSYKSSFYSYVDDIVSLDGFSLKSLKLLKGIIGKYKPNYLNSHGIYPDIMLFLIRGVAVKKLSTIHCIFYQDYLSKYNYLGLFYSLLHYLVLAFGGFHKIIGCSKVVANSLSNILFFNNIDYVDNGIDTRNLPINNTEKENLRNSLGLGNDFVITFCGNVERVKRVPELYEKYISKLDMERVKFMIVGDGPELEMIQGTNVIKVGRVTDPSIYLSISDVVVSNSSSEGYPMAILEALSHNCKVFLSDIPSHRYIISKYPKYAYDLKKLDLQLISDVLCIKMSEIELYSLSSDKMASDYLQNIKRVQ